MPRNVVTGAFSYTGKYIARRLLEMGEEVVTLTGHPQRQHPFGRPTAFRRAAASRLVAS